MPTLMVHTMQAADYEPSHQDHKPGKKHRFAKSLKIEEVCQMIPVTGKGVLKMCTTF